MLQRIQANNILTNSIQHGIILTEINPLSNIQLYFQYIYLMKQTSPKFIAISTLFVAKVLRVIVCFIFTTDILRLLNESKGAELQQIGYILASIAMGQLLTLKLFRDHMRLYAFTLLAILTAIHIITIIGFWVLSDLILLTILGTVGVIGVVYTDLQPFASIQNQIDLDLTQPEVPSRPNKFLCLEYQQVMRIAGPVGLAIGSVITELTKFFSDQICALQTRVLVCSCLSAFSILLYLCSGRGLPLQISEKADNCKVTLTVKAMSMLQSLGDTLLSLPLLFSYCYLKYYRYIRGMGLLCFSSLLSTILSMALAIWLRPARLLYFQILSLGFLLLLAFSTYDIKEYFDYFALYTLCSQFTYASKQKHFMNNRTHSSLVSSKKLGMAIGLVLSWYLLARDPEDPNFLTLPILAAFTLRLTFSLWLLLSKQQQNLQVLQEKTYSSLMIQVKPLVVKQQSEMAQLQ